MNEQLQQALAALLNKTVAGVEAGTAVLQAEIPEVIQQLLLWKLVSSALAALTCLMALAAIAITFRSIVRGVQSGEGIWHDSSSPIDGLSIFGFMFGVIGGVGSVPVCIGFFDNVGTALQIWIAPKIYLIEYAASLAK